MRYLSADCIIPVTSEPCYDSVLALDDQGTVTGLYRKSELKDPLNEVHHYPGILCPGFVNTHCHLELSWAKGMIPEGKGLDNFIRQLEKFRDSVTGTFIQKAIEEAVSVMEKGGIVATADIANGDNTLIFKSKSQHYFHTLIEVFGSDPRNASAVHEKAKHLKEKFENQQASGAVSVVPHSTYSVSEDLFRLVSSNGYDTLMSIHHQENKDENIFFKDGSGCIAERRKAFNPYLAPFPGTGKRPFESIADFLKPDQRILLVHNTVTEQQDIEYVEQHFRQVFWCFCPNANLFIEKLLPDINLFKAKKCKITLGTDSLASNHQLSILEEIKTIQQYYPDVPLTELLRWGTLNGAEFLGLQQKLGSFDKGKSPGVIFIGNVDIQTLQLNPASTSRLIIPARI